MSGANNAVNADKDVPDLTHHSDFKKTVSNLFRSNSFGSCLFDQKDLISEIYSRLDECA